jgi:hypothetical protein
MGLSQPPRGQLSEDSLETTHTTAFEGHWQTAADERRPVHSFTMRNFRAFRTINESRPGGADAEDCRRRREHHYCTTPRSIILRWLSAAVRILGVHSFVGYSGACRKSQIAATDCPAETTRFSCTSCRSPVLFETTTLCSEHLQCKRKVVPCLTTGRRSSGQRAGRSVWPTARLTLPQ